MKPTFQISQPVRRAESQRPQGHTVTTPATDWNFQSSAPDLRGSSAQSAQPVAPGFRVLTQGLFEADKRNYRLEGVAFVVIIAMAVWPMIAAAQAAIDLLK